jgi:hypothetical protein
MLAPTLPKRLARRSSRASVSSFLRVLPGQAGAPVDARGAHVGGELEAVVARAADVLEARRGEIELELVADARAEQRGAQQRGAIGLGVARRVLQADLGGMGLLGLEVRVAEEGGVKVAERRCV